jgi:hypothetical protein
MYGGGAWFESTAAPSNLKVGSRYGNYGPPRNKICYVCYVVGSLARSFSYLEAVRPDQPARSGLMTFRQDGSVGGGSWRGWPNRLTS